MQLRRLSKAQVSWLGGVLIGWVGWGGVAYLVGSGRPSLSQVSPANPPTTTPAAQPKAVTGSPEASTAEANALVEKGLDLRAQGRNKAAHAAFDQAIRIAPNYAEAYVARASLLYQQGLSPQAIETYDKAIRLNPNLVAAYLGKGQALARQGKRGEARQLLKQARRDFLAKGNRQQADVIQHLLPGL